MAEIVIIIGAPTLIFLLTMLVTITTPKFNDLWMQIGLPIIVIWVIAWVALTILNLEEQPATTQSKELYQVDNNYFLNGVESEKITVLLKDDDGVISTFDMPKEKVTIKEHDNINITPTLDTETTVTKTLLDINFYEETAYVINIPSNNN